MSLERLVEEIRQRAERELADERARVEAEEREIAQAKDRRIHEIESEGRRVAEADAAREKAQTIAAAKLQARKLVYAAREKRTSERLGDIRTMLREYTESPEYPSVLRQMVQFAIAQLGKSVRVRGRPEDAAALRSLAGKAFDATPVPILGGLIAETPDGSRRLNLSFDELLRLREDAIRGLLAK